MKVSSHYLYTIFFSGVFLNLWMCFVLVGICILFELAPLHFLLNGYQKHSEHQNSWGKKEHHNTGCVLFVSVQN